MAYDDPYFTPTTDLPPTDELPPEASANRPSPATVLVIAATLIGLVGIVLGYIFGRNTRDNS